jgi:hypothetical protein
MLCQNLNLYKTATYNRTGATLRALNNISCAVVCNLCSHGLWYTSFKTLSNQLQTPLVIGIQMPKVLEMAP